MVRILLLVETIICFFKTEIEKNHNYLVDKINKNKQTIVCSHSKVTKVNSKISLMKSSENDFIFSPAFYLIMCPMKAQKIFFENIHF